MRELIMNTLSNEAMASSASKMAITAKFFRALGDPARLTILDSLIERERNVGELVRIVGLSQGRVSSHLACLNQCGFVKSRRDRKLVYYSIADESIRQLLDASQVMIAKNAERILACTRVDAT